MRSRCLGLSLKHHSLPGILLVAILAGCVAGCARRQPAVNPPAPTPAPNGPVTSQPVPSRQGALPGQFTEEGMASWYGAPFDGRRTSDGEIYNMREFTAAHRTLPFNAVVRVTNLSNGRHVDVRINDRGPFVANRIIDLSYSAAEAIGMVGPGTARVHLDLIGGPDPNVGFFGVQVGAFQVQQNARRLQERLNAHYAPVSVAEFNSANGVFYRVRAGRLPSEAAARELANEIAAQEHMLTFVVRLDN
jgi:peptidoglycan lytic transglycosylase